MQSESPSSSNNPLRGIVSDEVYESLVEQGLLNDRAIRDYQIRQQFKKLREQRVPTSDAIDRLREKYPYLQFDTIRKIAYGLNNRS